MAESEEDIGDTDHEQLPVPSPKRAKVIDGQQSSIKTFTGAAAYKSGFQACWQKRWPCSLITVDFDGLSHSFRHRSHSFSPKVSLILALSG